MSSLYPIPPRRLPREEDSSRKEFEEIIGSADGYHSGGQEDVSVVAAHEAPARRRARPRAKRHALPTQPEESRAETPRAPTREPMRAGDQYRDVGEDSRLAHYTRLALAQGTGEDVLAHTHGHESKAGRFHLRLSLKHAYGIIFLLLLVVVGSWIWIFFSMQPNTISRPLGGSEASAVADASAGVDTGSGEATAGATTHGPASQGMPTEGGRIVVYVSGEVTRPGIYYLQEGERIGDAITQAGGLGENADDSAVNLAQRAEDGSHIHIPAHGEAPPSTGAEQGNNNVKLNSATIEELQTLPGIGPALADAIVQWREKNGPFAQPHDVTKVPGIGESTFAKFADHVTV